MNKERYFVWKNYDALEDIVAGGGGGGGGDDITSADVTAMTGYAKAQTASAISTSDTLNQAMGKLEKGLDGKEATIDANNMLDADLVSMEDYVKPQATSAIATTDTLNEAIGKLEKGLDGKEAVIDGNNMLDADYVSMEDYVIAQAAGAIATTDTLNEAIGKLEKGLDGKEDVIDSSNKLDADLVDDSTSTNKFATSAQISQITTNQTNIEAQQNAVADGGNGYALVNGIRLYVASSAPTGTIPDGSVGVGW